MRQSSHIMSGSGCLLSAGPVHREPLRDQSDGGADAARHHAVLRLRGRATEGPLPQHTLLQGANRATRRPMYGVEIGRVLTSFELAPPAARDQPVHHLLQLGEPRRAAGQEDHRAGLLVLLHPRQDAAVPPQPRLPRVPERRHPAPRLLRSSQTDRPQARPIDHTGSLTALHSVMVLLLS